jgi:hypothetical protein
MRVHDRARRRALPVRDQMHLDLGRRLAAGRARHQLPSRSVTTIISGVMKPLETLAGVISSRSGRCGR